MSEIKNKPSVSLERAIQALKNGSFVKIICGASNTSEKQVERLSMLYSLSGAHCIDFGPYENIVNASKKGIAKAAKIYQANKHIFPRFRPPLLMTSINVGDDKHFRKADLNISKCIKCLSCVKSCQSKALSSDIGEITFDTEKCYGCARCVEVCQQNAVNLIKQSDDINNNPNVLQTEAIEIHTGSQSIDNIRAYVELHRPVLEKTGLISVSIDSKRFNPDELIEFSNSIISIFDRKIILQVDGIMMRGGTSRSSTLQTLASSSELIDANVNAYIQLAGGTNHITKDLVNLIGLKTSGIAYGTFAKKIILSYIEDYNEAEFLENLDKIVKITTSLVTR